MQTELIRGWVTYDEGPDNKVAITGHAEWRHICPGQSDRHVSRITAIATLYDGDCAAARSPTF